MKIPFEKIDEEKRLRIINATIKEFSEKGYDRASTNEIVKNAGISKGILFHYFKNKNELYMYMYNSSIKLLIEEYFEKIDFNEKDFLKRVSSIIKLKIVLMEQHPEIFDFLIKSIYIENVEIKAMLDNNNKNMFEDMMGKIYSDIDYSIFKDGIDLQKAMSIIMWTFEGYSNSEVKKMKMLKEYKFELDRILKELDEYIEFFKGCFYKT